MKKKKTDFAVIIYICLAALLILGIKYFDQIAGVALKLWNVAFPLILGVAVAYVINIIMVRVERIYFPKTKNRFVAASRRGVSIVVSLLLVAGIFSLVARLVLPELGKAFAVIGRNVPIFLEEAAAWLEENNAGNTADMLKNVDWNSVMDKVADVVKSGFTQLCEFHTDRSWRCGRQRGELFYRSDFRNLYPFRKGKAAFPGEQDYACIYEGKDSCQNQIYLQDSQ